MEEFHGAVKYAYAYLIRCRYLKLYVVHGLVGYAQEFF